MYKRQPENYTAEKEGQWIQVSRNTVAESTFENKKKIAVYIKKVGVVGDQQIDGPSLAGAKFEIYDAATGGNKVGDWTTTTDATGSYTSNPVYLEAGEKYWYQETVAPEGYTKNEKRVEFTVPTTPDNNVFSITCLLYTSRCV